MSSGSDESIYWILTMVTKFSYHLYKIAINITQKQFTLPRYKTALSEVSHTMTNQSTTN
jgi:hypothetical protein